MPERPHELPLGKPSISTDRYQILLNVLLEQTTIQESDDKKTKDIEAARAALRDLSDLALIDLVNRSRPSQWKKEPLKFVAVILEVKKRGLVPAKKITNIEKVYFFSGAREESL
ncbi:MAG: hypothetical protein V1664_01155 [Candidatus Uhrbacteria bacterium]